jgi:hypothetical protein
MERILKATLLIIALVIGIIVARPYLTPETAGFRTF